MWNKFFFAVVVVVVNILKHIWKISQSWFWKFKGRKLMKTNLFQSIFILYSCICEILSVSSEKSTTDILYKTVFHNSRAGDSRIWHCRVRVCALALSIHPFCVSEKIWWPVPKSTMKYPENWVLENSGAVISGT